MNNEVILILMLIFVSADFALERILSVLNAKSGKKPIPRALEGIYDEAKYQKSQDYNQTVTRFGNITATLSFVITIAALYFGWFGLLDQWVRGFFTNEILVSLAFFGAIFVFSEATGTPFSYYKNFVIEEKFGFNKMTIRTFWMDKIKGLIITVLIGGVLIVALLYLVQIMGEGFWVYFWVIITAFVLFMNVFYTSWILPLFNKLTPMEDGELYQSIKGYSEKVNFPLSNIFVMDGSKRSSKGNAFFSGFGKRKKVVLFDTLIEKHTVEELTAVFAHEVGHFKKKHIVYSTIVSILTTGLMLYLLSLMIDNQEVSIAMGGSVSAIHLNILAFGILFTPVSRILGILSNLQSRKYEYEADRYADDTYDGKPLITALKTMSSDHLTNLTPHPAYVFLHYSHPTLLQRMEALEGKK
ncbi:MAG: M48 family metallopeptidase [Cyclobacteriaceae bacterium]|nr:M48 family metallopeptidase [Cyclobacteriaceae bacterium SS2]